MDIIDLYEKLKSGYKGYIESFVSIKDKRIEETVSKAIHDESLWPDALIQFNPNFEKGKSEIDQLDSKKIEWKRLDDKKASYVNVKLKADIRNKSDWPRQFDWMYKTMMGLHKVLKPYYENIRKIK